MATNRSSAEETARTMGVGGTVRLAEERGDAVPGDRFTGRDGTRTGARTTLTEQRSARGLRQRLRVTLELIRANPTGRIALKIFVSIAGALVVTVGVALIPLPGPGWLLVIAGLGIWAVEFHWARRLLGFTRRHVHNWTRWVTSRSLPVRVVLGTIGLIFVAAVVWLSLKYSLGIDVVARLLHYLATH